MNTKFIYTLSDPNTGLVRYIGKTSNIRKRLSSHLSNSHLSSSTKKNNWIISLLRNNQIEKCCKEKGYYQTKNLTFRYEGDAFDYTPYKHYRPSRKYKIGIYSDNNELVSKFDSLKEVVSYTGIGKQYISNVCKENGSVGMKKLKGYIFRFI